MPYRILDPLSTFEFPLDQADVSTTALIIDGTTLIEALFAAITNGDCAAVPVDRSKSGSLDGTTSPICKI